MNNSYLALVAGQADQHSVNIPGLEFQDSSSISVVVYPSGRKLLESLRKNPAISLPEYIILDLGQLEEEDMEAIRILKADDRFRTIPVLTRRLTHSRRSVFHVEPGMPRPLPFAPYQ